MKRSAQYLNIHYTNRQLKPETVKEMKRTQVYYLSLLLCMPLTSIADTFEKHADYTVCFTPGQDCTGEIVNAINGAVSDIWVQSYSFTSRPIAKALQMAEQRGVKVQIIMDKSALTGKSSALHYFTRQHIPVWIDSDPAIAHNKVMIIDRTRVITGSFNFTFAAQNKNAENLLIIDDAGLAKKYLNNWQRRQMVSKRVKPKTYSTTPGQPNWLTLFMEWLTEFLKKFFNGH